MNAMVDNAVKVLSEPDLQLGIVQIESTSAVSAWFRHGKPDEDIETEVGNVIRYMEDVNRPGYRTLRTRMMRKYKIDEREFVRQLFQRMSRR